MTIEFHQPRPMGEPADGGLLWRAPAKLNLTLSVVGRREDGFHELDSLVAKVTLYDELLVRPRDDGEVRLKCSPFDCGPVEDNLACRAASLLLARAGGGGADIDLTKRIPPGSGLGGGSSDAAAALAALNELWRLDLPRERLAELAAELGSDVPLFLNGPAARIRGRGERVEPVEMQPFFALLWMPELSCPTAEVYAAYDRLAGHESKPARGTGPHNDLEPAAREVCPELGEIASKLSAATGLDAHLTGSGSAMFVLAADERQARAAAEGLPDDLPGSGAIVTLNPW